jgi:predicted exporter
MIVASSTDADEPEAEEASLWIRRHPRASLIEAYTAGYVEGYRAARRALHHEARQKQAAEQSLPTTAEAKQLRTFIAALERFRDQVLVGNPPEVQTGEWLSADEVATLIAKLRDDEAVRV